MLLHVVYTVKHIGPVSPVAQYPLWPSIPCGPVSPVAQYPLWRESRLDLNQLPYVLYCIKYIDPVSPVARQVNPKFLHRTP